MNVAPPVSCMCLTYGRPPQLLEEAIESFLRQDYQGEKELIVLNDLPQQKLRFEHLDVQIINVGKRFRTVGEKRNACAALCSHDVLFVWDDDDIYLPWRISFSMEMMGRDRHFFKSARSFMLSNGIVTGPLRNLFHSSSCWNRSLFEEVQGYPPMGSGQDLEIERKFAHALGLKRLASDIPLERIYYIYRWAGTESYHLSWYGKNNKSEDVVDYIFQRLESGEVPAGEIHLKPHWKVDYVAIVAQYLQR